MRLILTISLVALISINSLAQSSGRRPKSTTYSASSEWQKVTLRQTTRLGGNASSPGQPVRERIESTSGQSATPDGSDFRPAFTGDFSTNRNGWRAGNRGDYYYQIGLGRYSIRKRNTNTQKSAFSAVELPTNINLNKADHFTIKVDVLADSGQVPTGGILFGVKDSLNYSAFTLNGKGEVSIMRIANGQTFSDYMPGDFFMPGVTVDKNRNRLIIRRKGEELHFYINEQEIRSSPYLFKMLPGNGIGLTSSGYWTSFQKLIVTLGQ
ncbi:hypothetical protein [Spirosoma aerolatum]|uniref:hypothetical protein n=1 Tax=Spirosoma aerolatum TaxID=1211326 RepID=UPI0009ABE370|nr:hypothetical protein [Spirosoma aerolatum]